MTSKSDLNNCIFAKTSRANLFPGLFFLTVFSLISGMAHSQNIVVSGRVFADDNFPLANVSIGCNEANYYTVSNQSGFFSLRLKSDICSSLSFSYLGFKEFQLELSELSEFDDLTIVLSPKTLELGSITVFGEALDRSQDAQMSSIRLPVESIERMPSFLGQKDVLKSIQFLPGVATSIEGFAGSNVRGGSADQSAIIFDGVPLYYAYHSGGFVTALPTNVFQTVAFYTGGFPGQFGDRLSSITEINSKNGSRDKLSGSMELGLISAEVFAEIPVPGSWNDSFMLNIRSSTLPSTIGNMSLQKEDVVPNNPFFDLYAKYHLTTSTSALYASYFLSDDEQQFNSSSNFSDDQIRFQTENTSSTKRRTYFITTHFFKQLSKAVIFESSLYSTKYGSWQRSKNSSRQSIIENGAVIRSTEALYNTQSTIVENAISGKLEMQPLPWAKFTVGNQLLHRNYRPYVEESINRNEGERVLNGSGADTVSAVMNSSYVSLRINPIKFLEIIAGVRLNSFQSDNSVATDWLPRGNVRFNITQSFALKASYMSEVQTSHQLRGDGFGTQADLWVAATGDFSPQKVETWAFGIAFSKPEFEVTLEFYDKNFNNLVAFRPGSSFLLEKSEWQDLAIIGSGHARGIELNISKRFGKLSGWFNYTYSESIRNFEEISDNEEFRFTYDRPHMFNLVGSYSLNEIFQINSNATFFSGHLFSLANGVVSSNFESPIPIDLTDWIFFVDEKNNTRLPNYFRLDFSVDATIQFREKYEATLSVGMYNTLDRRNPIGGQTVFFFRDGNIGRPQAEYYYLFPRVPYISLKAEF